MSTDWQEPNFIHETIIELLKQHLQDQNTELQALTQKSQYNLNLSTSVLVLIGFSTLLNLNKPPIGWILSLSLLWAVVFYVSLRAMKPRGWAGAPFMRNWSDVHKVSRMNEAKIYRWLTLSYFDAVKANQVKLKNIKRLSDVSFFALIFQALLICAFIIMGL